MEFSYLEMKFEVPDDVYPPAEDSWMLADAAVKLRGEVLEVGCGCGLAGIVCAAADKSNRVTGIDVNPIAVLCASRNARLNGISNIRFLEGDLFAPVQGRTFDAIMFNPPYLPTSEEERLEGGINRAYDGGKDGRETLDLFLSRVDAHLRPGGVLLLVQSSLNAIEKTEFRLSELGYASTAEKEQPFFFERLLLLKALKPHL